MKILLVEDHALSREGARKLLSAEGVEVFEANGGHSALQQLRERAFDVVLLDMMLPDLDGREVLKAVQADRPAALRAVLVLTGDLTAERQEEVRRLGVDGLIAKPIEIMKLLTTLRTVRAVP